jgi:hypothetical protein
MEALRCLDAVRLPDEQNFRWTVPTRRFFLMAFSQNLRKATISFVMSVCPSVRLSAWNNSAATGRIFMKFDI